MIKAGRKNFKVDNGVLEKVQSLAAQGLRPPFSAIITPWDRAVVARVAHNHQVVGSIPTPTIFFRSRFIPILEPRLIDGAFFVAKIPVYEDNEKNLYFLYDENIGDDVEVPFKKSMEVLKWQELEGLEQNLVSEPPQGKRHLKRLLNAIKPTQEGAGKI